MEKTSAGQQAGGGISKLEQSGSRAEVGEEMPGREEGERLAFGKGVGREENPVREQEQQVGKWWGERGNGTRDWGCQVGQKLGWGGRGDMGWHGGKMWEVGPGMQKAR